jgi:hypothetical protein
MAITKFIVLITVCLVGLVCLNQANAVTHLLITSGITSLISILGGVYINTELQIKMVGKLRNMIAISTMGIIYL